MTSSTTSVSSIRNTSPPYDNTSYGSRNGIDNNNCYAYSIDYFKYGGHTKLQPGDIAKTFTSPLSLNGCTSLDRRVMEDLKGEVYRPRDASEQCKPGYHMIAAVLSPKEDFHFYRRHRDVLYKLPKGQDATSFARWAGVSPDQVHSVGDQVLVRDAGLWSHKRGFGTGPLLEDSCGQPIRSPAKACRNYSKEGGPDYSKPCGLFCVKTKSR